MNEVLSIKGLAIGYKGKTLNAGINLSLRIGEVTAIIGRNGVGKSTLIKTVTGSLKSLGGEVTIKGKNIQAMTRREKAKEMAIVTTDGHTAGGLRIEELVALGRIPHTGRLGILQEEDKKKTDRALEEVGLAHKKGCFIAELSDGERQKGMIAKALVQETPIILMDEPFSYLDVAARLEMYALLKEIARKEGKAIVYSTHEVGEALKYADKIWIFSGKGIKAGTPREHIEGGELDNIFDNRNVRFDRDKGEYFWNKEQERK